jgi:hypothetical protein
METKAEHSKNKVMALKRGKKRNVKYREKR